VNCVNIPLVTVIISVYDNPAFVNQAIRSVLDQDFEDYELIVVDDCSEKAVTDQYVIPRSARLICLSENHGQASTGRNAGIEEARGKYIAFLDMDDIWLPEKLRVQVSALESNPDAALTFGPVLLVDSELTPIREQEVSGIDFCHPLRRLIYGNFICTPSCVLVRRDMMLECGMFEDSLPGCWDWDMWIRLAQHYPFHFDPTVSTMYRVHEGQATRSDDKMLRSSLSVYEKLLYWTMRENPSMTALVRHRKASALRRLARLEMHQGKNQDAVNTLIGSIRTHPSCITGYLLLAKVLLRSRQSARKSDGVRSSI